MRRAPWATADFSQKTSQACALLWTLNRRITAIAKYGKQQSANRRIVMVLLYGELAIGNRARQQKWNEGDGHEHTEVGIRPRRSFTLGSREEKKRMLVAGEWRARRKENNNIWDVTIRWSLVTDRYHTLSRLYLLQPTPKEYNSFFQGISELEWKKTTTAEA